MEEKSQKKSSLPQWDMTWLEVEEQKKANRKKLEPKPKKRPKKFV